MLLATSILSYLVILGLLAALARIDVREYILPDRLNAALAITFATFHITTGWKIVSPPEAFWGAVAGLAFMLAVRQAANRFYKEDSLGLGDVKLIGAAGIGLGFPDIMLALSLGSLFGLLHGGIMALQMKMHSRQPVSFGQINVPAGLGLAAGIAIVMVVKFGFFWTGFS